MGYIQFSNQTLYYAARGSNDTSHFNRAPLVFIHGAGDTHLVWNGQLAAFANFTRAYALDLPGHGRSTGAARTTISAYALAVRKFLDALKIPRAIIAGISMGGAIAQTLALESPEYVMGLVLAGTGAKLRVAPYFLAGIQNDFETAARLLVENYYAPGAASALQGKSQRQLLVAGRSVTFADYAACDAFDVRERLPSISAPTLVICGCEDKMTPPRYSEFLAKHIPGAQLVLIEHAGHMVMLEQPTAFNTALRDWLATL